MQPDIGKEGQMHKSHHSNTITLSELGSKPYEIGRQGKRKEKAGQGEGRRKKNDGLEISLCIAKRILREENGKKK